MAELPKSIRVGYRAHPVVLTDSEQMLEHSEDGSFQQTSGRIRIRDGMEAERAANVMLHEVIHACWYNGDLGDQAAEEKAVTVLANQLSQVWRDNPDFVAFMSDSLNPEPTFPTEQETIGTVIPLKA